MGKLAGKVAIVTGASKGIGAGIARALSDEGAAVVVNYASSKAGADQVVDAILSNGGQAIAVQGDVSNASDVQRIFEETHERFGAVDVLVNNAGVYQFHPIEAITEGDFHRQFNVNVLGTILATQEAVKHFGPDGGSVINVSSVASTKGLAGSTVYAATKSAVDALTGVLANELGGRKIRVNVIAPGMVVTEGAETSMDARRLAARGAIRACQRRAAVAAAGARGALDVRRARGAFNGSADDRAGQRVAGCFYFSGHGAQNNIVVFPQGSLAAWPSGDT